MSNGLRRREDRFLGRGVNTAPRVDATAFRAAASRFATGVTVITALDEERGICAMTANSFVTVSLSPPTVLILTKANRTQRAIEVSGRYGVNILPDNAAHVSAHFGGRPDPSYAPQYEFSHDLPRLTDSIAFFACEVVREITLSDHSMFIAEVTGCNSRDSAPLVFFGSRYHQGPGEPFGG